MKWRKFYRNRGLGTNAILDTLSEIDMFDWSPCNSDKSLMGGIDDYCWTADTLFSTINTPFPFPDPREIGKYHQYQYSPESNYDSGYESSNGLQQQFYPTISKMRYANAWLRQALMDVSNASNCVQFTAKAGIADFIQPSLGPLQPNLDEFMAGIPLQGECESPLWESLC